MTNVHEYANEVLRQAATRSYLIALLYEASTEIMNLDCAENVVRQRLLEAARKLEETPAAP